MLRTFECGSVVVATGYEFPVVFVVVLGMRRIVCLAVDHLLFAMFVYDRPLIRRLYRYFEVSHSAPFAALAEYF